MQYMDNSGLVFLSKVFNAVLYSSQRFQSSHFNKTAKLFKTLAQKLNECDSIRKFDCEIKGHDYARYVTLFFVKNNQRQDVIQLKQTPKQGTFLSCWYRSEVRPFKKYYGSFYEVKCRLLMCPFFDENQAKVVSDVIKGGNKRALVF